MVEKKELLYGKVRILKGDYAGRLGEYDDDTEEGTFNCVVYLCDEGVSEDEPAYIVVPADWLEQVENESITGEDDKEPEGSS